MANLNVKLNPKQATTVVTYPDGSTHDINCALLLHMEGVSGGTSFVDSSLGYKTATITNTATTTSSTTQKFGSTSALFNGSTSSLSLTDSTDWSLGTGNFTIDFWVNFSSTAARTPFVCKYLNATNQFRFAWIEGGYIQLYVTIGGDDRILTTLVTWTPTVGTWYHIALVRSGTNIYTFINGALSGTFAVGSIDMGTIASPLLIGSHSTYFLNGYMDEVRFMKGYAAWTSAFTPPTERYPGREEYCGGSGVDANTALLIHGDGTDSSTNIVDSSFITPKQITPVGSAQIKTAQSKFGSSSILLNGTTDYLTIPDSADWYITGDYTVEFWINFTSLTGYQVVYGQKTDNSNYFDWFYYNSTFVVDYVAAGSAVFRYTVPFSASTGIWYHVAVVRSGNTWNTYIDGVAGSKTLNVGSYSYAPPDMSGVLYVGQDGFGSYVKGYLDEFRVSKGIAKYSADFTPATIPFKGREDLGGVRPDPLDVLVLHGDGTDSSTTIVDSSISNKAVTVVGSAHISTAQSVFGGSSIALNGTTDYVYAADSADFNFAAGDFTQELWVNFSSIGQYGPIMSQQNGTSEQGFYSYYQPAYGIYWRYRATDTVRVGYGMAWTPTIGVWYHLAFVRQGTNFYAFINGVSQSLTVENAIASKTLNDCSGPYVVGGIVGEQNFFGYMEEARVTKGKARYTVSFTPPSRSTGGREQIANAGKESFPGFQRIGDFTSAGTESSYMLNVNGDTDKEYRIASRTLGSDQIYLRLNGDSGLNYGTQYLYTGGTPTAGRDARAQFGVGTAAYGMTTWTLLTPPGFVKTMNYNERAYTSGTTLQYYTTAGANWNNTANVTTLNFVKSAGNFIAGERITVYVRRSQ
jgi:hypothetical protein